MGAARTAWKAAKASATRRVPTIEKMLQFNDDFGPMLDKLESGLADAQKDAAALQKRVPPLAHSFADLKRKMRAINARLSNQRGADNNATVATLRRALDDVELRLVEVIERLEPKTEVLARGANDVIPQGRRPDNLLIR